MVVRYLYGGFVHVPFHDLVGVMTGNIMSPPQGELVLRNCGLMIEEEDPFPDSGHAYRMGKLPDKQIPDVARRLHWRLGHPGITKLKAALKQMPDDADKPTPEQIAGLDFCRTCARSKLEQGPHGRTQNVRERARFQNALLHVDTCFRRYPDGQGRHMIMMCVDDFSRWATCEFYSSRKKAPFQAMLARLEGRVHAHSRQCYEALNTPGLHNGRPPLCMRTDGEGSILCQENVDRQLAKREPLDLECITAGAKGHAGVVERCHRTIIQITRSLMAAVAWPMDLWSHAWKHALWLYNRLPHPANEQRSPYYILHRKPPDWSRVRTFGCTCYVYVTHPHRVNKSKLNASGERRVYVGQPP